MYIVNDKMIQVGNPIVGSTILPSPPILFDHKVSTIQSKDFALNILHIQT